MTHAGVVYPENTTIIAQGKKLFVQGMNRGEVHSDVITIRMVLSNGSHKFSLQLRGRFADSSDEEGANKIVPVLTHENKNKNASYNSALQSISMSNLRINTSNGLSSDTFSEYITDTAYFYALAPRPGLMGRFNVACM